MSTALYRRYRPDTFADVIGQEHVTTPLVTALGKDAVSHAYLFSGPRGCGKTTSARILARCLNCVEGPTGNPCGKCESCRDLATGGSGSLDVIEIDAASHGGVDDARDLRERATFAPVRDRYKIFIIDEAHMVTAAGFNALLKIVEEPPEHIKFIFATTEPDKVIGTIRSRTHHYPFRLVPPEPLLKYLEQLCAQEDVPVAPGVLQLVIRAGEGSVRDTLSVLDQLIAGSTETGIDYDLATALLGFTHATLLDDVVESTAALDGATAFNVVDRVVQSGQDPRRFVEDLLERLRDLIIVKSVPDSPGAILRGVPDDQIDRMKTQAARLGPAELSRAADITAQALTDMMGATSPRLHLELLMARLLLPHAEHGHSSLAARLEQLERRLDFVAGAGVTPAASSQSNAAALAQQDSSDAQVAAPADQQPPGQNVPADDGWDPPTPPEATTQVSGSRQAAPAQEDTPPPEEPAAPATPPVDDHGWALPGAGGPSDTGDAEETGSREETERPAAQSRPPAQSGGTALPQGTAGPAAPGGGQVEMMRRAWPDIVESVKGQSRMLWMLVKGNVTVAGFDGESLTLAFSNDGARSTFTNRSGEQALGAAVQQVLGMQIRFDLITGGTPSEAGGGSPKAEGRPQQPAAEQPAPPAEPSASSTTAPFDAGRPDVPSAEALQPKGTPPGDARPKGTEQTEQNGAPSGPGAVAVRAGTAVPDLSSPPATGPSPSPEEQGAPAWVAEEPSEEHESSYDVEPEPPQEPPSPHPAWVGDPSLDPAGVTEQDDPPEQRDPFDGASAEVLPTEEATTAPEALGSIQDTAVAPETETPTDPAGAAETSPPSADAEPATESYRVFEEKPPVPAFARRSSPSSSGGRSAPGEGGAHGQSDAGASAGSAPEQDGRSEASGRIAEIRRRMAKRRSEAGATQEEPPPEPFEGNGAPAPSEWEAPSTAGTQTSAPSSAEETEEDFSPSDDDVALEESGVFGRAALERVLGATLIEERRLGGD